MVGRALTDLMMAGHAATLEELPRLVADHAAAVGLNDVAFFLVDLQGRVLRQVTGRGLDAGTGGVELAVDATVAGLAFQRVDLVVEPDASSGREGRRWWVPVTDGVERLGMLRADTSQDDAATRDALRALASMVALLLLSKRGESIFWDFAHRASTPLTRCRGVTARPRRAGDRRVAGPQPATGQAGSPQLFCQAVMSPVSESTR